MNIETISFGRFAAGVGAYTEEDYEGALPLMRRAYAENPLYNPTLRVLAASLAGSGRLAEAREMAQALLRLEPGFRVREFCRGYAYRNPKDMDRLANHLLLAGLPPWCCRPALGRDIAIECAAAKRRLRGQLSTAIRLSYLAERRRTRSSSRRIQTD